MTNWLQNSTSGCTGSLGNISTSLSAIQKDFTDANDSYYAHAQSVTQPDVYQGQGATGFLDAVNADINKSKLHIDGIGHVASATTLLQTAMESDSRFYDGQLDAISNDAKYEVPQNIFDGWRDDLINGMLAAGGTLPQTLQLVLTSGSQYVSQHWQHVYSGIKAYVPLGADSYMASTLGTASPGYIPDTSTQAYKDAEKILECNFTSAFDDLAASIQRNLQYWAEALFNAYGTFKKTLANPEYLSARDLFNYISSSSTNSTQGTNTPITITPYTGTDGKKGLLVTLAGTDPGHGWDDSVITALQTGTGVANNPYQREIINAIVLYMAEHPEMKGSEMTIAGYSMGGMLAQNVADIISSSTPSDLSQYNFHVANVMTYGSPVMGPPAKGVQYSMFDATYDPVPLLSKYENSHLASPALVSTVSQLVSDPYSPATLGDLFNGHTDAISAYQSLQRADSLPWNQKVNTYFDPKHQYKGQIYNINDVGNQTDGSTDSLGLKQLLPTKPYFVPTPGHSLNFGNHLQYGNSNQLNAPTTNLTGIDPSTLGPTEYFGLYTN